MKASLEVVVVPVADVDRARSFYEHALGFAVDHDTTTPDGSRLVQLTPSGSGSSITVGTITPAGLPVGMAPGTLDGLQLVVSDLRAAHAELEARGIANGGLEVFDETGLRPAREGDRFDFVGFVRFRDPDGNGWIVQQLKRPEADA